MSDHKKFADLAVRLIDKNGRAITLQTLSGAAADPNKPWLGAGAPTVSAAVDTKAVFLPASGNDLGKIITSKELLASVEQVALIAPHASLLEEMTVMLDDGKVWKVEWVQVLKPGDQICLYLFGVKR